ncbi:MAG: M28 family peptidase, partial [bacterium]
MKRMAVILSVLIGFALAQEFLAIVPNAKPEALAGDFAILGVTGNGVLIIGAEQKWQLLSSFNARILDFNPREKVYYRVHLFDWSKTEELARISRILDFDGEEYLVAVAPEGVESLMRLGAMLGRISLKGWVFQPVRVELPPVLSNPLIEQMVASISPDSVLSYVSRLQRYRTRYSTSDSCRAAAEWIRQRFVAYGCDTVILQNHTPGHAPNVIGIKYGTSGQRNPYAIICGHFDSYAPSNAPGADDNASGTAAVLEAARVTQDYLFEYDLRFIAFSGEEFGLYGSEYYAGQARAQGDSILGVLNFDMIGYVDAEPENLDVLGKINNPPCEPFVDWFTAIADTYATLPVYKRMVNDNQNSDHGPFWNNGYLAFCGIEDFWPVNPWYHTPGDSIGAGYNSNDFCTQVIRAGVAGLATLGQPVPVNMPLLGLLRTRVDDAAGNNNGLWDPGESIGVYLVLKNFGTIGAHNVNATISTTDTFVTVYQDSAGFGDIAGGDTAVNTLPYSMRASGATPREHQVSFNLTITAQESTYHTGFSLQVGQYLITDPIPDGPRWPPRYWAYDDIDTGYAEHPVFEWIEINTIGTRLVYPQNDSVKVIAL